MEIDEFSYNDDDNLIKSKTTIDMEFSKSSPMGNYMKNSRLSPTS